MVHQELAFCENLSVAENLYLAVPGNERPAYGRMETWAASTLEEFELAETNLRAALAWLTTR